MLYRSILLLLLFPALAFQLLPVDGDPWKAPAEADTLVDPMANDPKAVQKGQKIFSSLCWTCHGMSGKGDGPNAEGLQVHPTDLGSAAVQSQTKGAIYWKITHGRGEMASYEQVISREQRWALVHYLRTLKHPAQ